MDAGADRPTPASLEPPWRECLELSWQARCAGSIPIGAVVVHDASGRVLARGRNRICETDCLPGQVAGNQLAHAELNALVRLRRGTVDLRQCTLYTAVEPCPLCVGALYMSGIRRARFACRDAWAGSSDLLGTTPYLSLKPVTIDGPAQSWLEDIVLAVQVEHLRGERRGAASEVIEVWRADSPPGVALGEEAFRRGLLADLAATGADWLTAFSALHELGRGLSGD